MSYGFAMPDDPKGELVQLPTFLELQRQYISSIQAQRMPVLYFSTSHLRPNTRQQTMAQPSQQFAVPNLLRTSLRQRRELLSRS